MNRNICDGCANCEDRNKSISYCFDVCSAPIDIISDMERARNDTRNFNLAYRQALRDICDLMNDCEYPEDLEMALYDFMIERGMKV